MRNTPIIVSLFVALCGTTSARAQKAYDIILYQTTLYGNKTTLQLADGYLLTSKVLIYSKFGNQVFSPSVNEPDDHGDLRFDAAESTGRYKHNTGSWLTLKGLNKPEYPSKIKAIYWDGKVQTTVIFKQR